MLKEYTVKEPKIKILIKLLKGQKKLRSYTMMMGFGGLGLLIIIAAVYFIVKNFVKQNNNSSNKESALDILKKRFANGEISKEEFEEKKRILL